MLTVSFTIISLSDSNMIIGLRYSWRWWGCDLHQLRNVVSCSSTLVKVYINIFNYLKPQKHTWRDFYCNSFLSVSCLARLLQVHPCDCSTADDSDRSHQALSWLRWKPARKGEIFFRTQLKPESRAEININIILMFYLFGRFQSWLASGCWASCCSFHSSVFSSSMKPFSYSLWREAFI